MNDKHSGLSGQVVLFDAVGTVIFPEPSVVAVYHRIAQRYRSQMTVEEIASRFAPARKRFFHVGEAYSEKRRLVSSDEIERALWKHLVGFVLHDVAMIEAPFDELWEHFSLPSSWKMYPDVQPCWQELRSRGAKIGIVSNFDSRLIEIVKQDETLSKADFVFCSAEIGFRKPDSMLYDSIDKRLHASGDVAGIFMVGDDRENDCHAARRAGWKAVWLNRKQDKADWANRKDAKPKDGAATDSIDSLASLPGLIRAC